MANLIENNLDLMRTDNETIKNHISALQASSDNAIQAMEALNAMWSGVAHLSFLSQLEKDQEEMAQLILSLNNYHEELENVRYEFEQCESAVREKAAALAR